MIICLNTFLILSYRKLEIEERESILKTFARKWLTMIFTPAISSPFLLIPLFQNHSTKACKLHANYLPVTSRRLTSNLQTIYKKLANTGTSYFQAIYKLR